MANPKKGDGSASPDPRDRNAALLDDRFHPEPTAPLETAAPPALKPVSEPRPAERDHDESDAPRTVVASELLEQHFAVAAQIGTPEETEAAYEASIAALRPHAKEVAFLLYDEYLTAEAGSLQRFSAVKTLGDLVSPDAYDLLLDIAQRPLPPKDGAEDHVNDPLVHERIVRLEAITGLARLAEAGFEPAARALHDFAVGTDPQRSLRMAAISGFIGTGPGATERALELRPHLPAELQSSAVPPPSKAEARAAYLAMPASVPE